MNYTYEQYTESAAYLRGWLGGNRCLLRVCLSYYPDVAQILPRQLFFLAPA